MREAFEKALRENPDDLTGWSAYADYLTEQGDPRGEFIAVQLALEDETRSKEERDELKRREAELLAAHEREWLGEFAPYLLGDESYSEYATVPADRRWRHRFLSSVTVPYLTRASAQALAATPSANFLRELWVSGTSGYFGTAGDGQPPPRVPTPPGSGEHWELFELIGSPCLDSLRMFRMGDVDGEPPEDGWADCHTYTGELFPIVASMPRVEELHLLCKGYDPRPLFALPNMTRLRVLRVYHLGEYSDWWGDRGGRYEYPLDILAANPALGSLTHLLFHPHFVQGEGDDGRSLSFLPLDQVRALVRSPHLPGLTHLQLRLSNMGDEGVREIVASGILKRLKWLDLRHGCVTDDGARVFAACPDAKNLDRLDLSRNAVTPTGLAVLRAARVNAVANNPLTEQELADEQYLREGDFE
ncbi:MAG TPA: TIGR02996 domain-containing protein [Gemmataceae bacterium]|nr:TIGR02996 domain-containing protein [Gemmataceae bacterium]